MKQTNPKLSAVKVDPDGPALLLSPEDAQAYTALTDQFMADLKPHGAIELRLTRSIIRTTWRLRQMESIGESMITMGTEAKYVLQVNRQEERLNKMLLQLTAQLERTQAGRRKRQISEAMGKPGQSSLVH